MFAELQRLSKSLNSRGDSWQGSPIQIKINEGESGRVALPVRGNRLEFPRYADDDPTKCLNHVAHIILNIMMYRSKKKR